MEAKQVLLLMLLASTKPEELKVVTFLKQPERFISEPDSGVLLVGSPGTGKTLLAKAIAEKQEYHF